MLDPKGSMKILEAEYFLGSEKVIGDEAFGFTTRSVEVHQFQSSVHPVGHVSKKAHTRLNHPVEVRL